MNYRLAFAHLPDGLSWALVVIVPELPSRIVFFEKHSFASDKDRVPLEACFPLNEVFVEPQRG
ncbi:unnamed protein product [Protopolystoma xenopodis]|uniref:Uncharacterized protein n=1 Tax=Protopolystoma xenopodis TaxID=117903 RepID=A0A448X785_9PLAT|nr:unnamed protein product [Protopolystoma xenopodis]